VDPEYRGKGIARILMEQSIKEARIRGFKLFKVPNYFSQKSCLFPIQSCRMYIFKLFRKHMTLNVAGGCNKCNFTAYMQEYGIKF
jgi:GNAT superfamily N-acetyltransferase